MSMEPYRKKTRGTDITAYSTVRDVGKVENKKPKASFNERLQAGFDTIHGGIRRVQDTADVINRNVNFDVVDLMGGGVFGGGEGLGSFDSGSIEGGESETRRKTAPHKKKSTRSPKRHSVTINF